MPTQLRILLLSGALLFMHFVTQAQTECYQWLLSHAIEIPYGGEGQHDSITQTRSHIFWQYKDGVLDGQVVGLFFNGDTMFVAHFKKGAPVGRFWSYNQVSLTPIANGIYDYPKYVQTFNQTSVKFITVKVSCLGIMYNFWQNSITATSIRPYGNVGDWREYYCNGNLKMIYNDSKQSTAHYDTTGTLIATSYKEADKETTYDPKGNMIYQIEYYPGDHDRVKTLFKGNHYAIQNGNGIDTVYASHGEISRILPYKKGYVTGKVVFFTMLGRPMKQCKYKKGEQGKCKSLLPQPKEPKTAPPMPKDKKK